MQIWDLNSLDVQVHQPEVLASDDEGRAIVINLPGGEKLDEHQVHERAWLMVTSGTVEIEDANGNCTAGGVGTLATFEPNERHEIRATEDARVLLVLSPWPGEGHPNLR